MATVISAPTTVTEDGFEVTQRASIQVYQPLYQPGMPTMTVQQRRAASIGWAGIRVDLNEALAGLGLDDSLLDVTMQAEGSDVIAESRPGVGERVARADLVSRSDEHPSEPQPLMRTSYAVFCL